jgi:CBS domain-containing protein
MLRYKISGLPVVDDAGILVGIITESDIFRLVVHDWLREAEPV